MLLVLTFGINLIRGGIIFWADSLGSKYIYSRLAEWSKLYGEFFKPSAYLAARAAKGISLVRNQRSCALYLVYRTDTCLLGCILLLFTQLHCQFDHCGWSRIVLLDYYIEILTQDQRYNRYFRIVIVI